MPVNGKWMTPPPAADGTQGPNKWVINEQVPDAAAKGFTPQPGDDQLGIIDESGNLGKVGLADYPGMARAAGERLATQQELDTFRDTAARKEAHSGLGQGLKAAAWSLGNTLTAGVPDTILHHFDPEADRERQSLEADRPYATGAGELLGLGAGLVTGGTEAKLAEGGIASGVGDALALTPGGVARSAGSAAEKALGGGVVGRVGRSAVEGAALSVPQSVEQLGTTDDPLTIERIGSILGGNALHGAELGGALGAGGELLSAGAGASAVKGTASKIASALSDAKALPEALATEEGIAAVEKSVVDDIGNYHQQVSDANPWLATDSSASLTKSAGRLRRLAVDNPIALARNPQRAYDIVTEQQTALERIVEKGPATLAKLQAEDGELARGVSDQLAKLPDEAETVTVTGKAAQRYSQNVLGKNLGAKGAAKGVELPIADAQKLADGLAAGEMKGARAVALEKAPEVIQANKAIIEKLDQLKTARRLLAQGPQQGLLGKTVQHAIQTTGTTMAMGLVPGGHLLGIGAMAYPLVSKAIGALASRVATAVGEAGASSAGALDAFLAPAARVATKGAIPLATATLRSVRYADEAAPAVKQTKNALADVYKQRAAELHSTVIPGPDGSPQMTLAARQAVAAKLRPLHAISPQLADQAETFVAKKQAFLASKLPIPPGYTTLQIGPDRWQPSDIEMRRFARFAAAAESAQGIEQRMAKGVVSPEDAETYKVLFPEHLAALKRNIVERLPTIRHSLSYEKRLSLSMLAGIPIVPALRPEILNVIQGAHKTEEGTEGGTQAPVASPQFGSVRSNVMGTSTETVAQRISQG